MHANYGAEAPLSNVSVLFATSLILTFDMCDVATIGYMKQINLIASS